MSIKKKYIVLFGNNEYECLQLILLGWIKGFKMTVFSPGMSLRIIDILKHLPHIRGYIRKSIKERDMRLGDYKGLWYKINQETIDLTVKFYDQKLKGENKIISDYNRIFNTDKFKAYVKKEISNQIFALLKDLYMAKLSSFKEYSILISRTPVNEFVVKYMQLNHGLGSRIRWLSAGWGLFCLFPYYGWLLAEIVRRGLALNAEKKTYKISMEAAWGFYRKTLRNDIVVDNKRFKLKDVLILRFFRGNDPQRDKAFKEAEERGFDTVSVPNLKINITNNIFDVLIFYFWLPVKNYFYLLFRKRSYFFYYIFLFHRKCFPIELLMNLYSVKCHISMVDCDDIATTIILNKYGAKNMIFHWSDLTFYKAYNHAFIAHNNYFVWGDIHYDYHADNCFVDKKINIGCIYKEEYNRAIGDKEGIVKRISSLKANGKTVTFFDVSFGNYIHFTEGFFLDYLELIKEFCRENKDMNVLLKPKSEENYEINISRDKINRFRMIWDELTSFDNFIYLNPLDLSIEEIIAISDVCISMGMNSPSTIALICGKDALYFDNTGNVFHPFAVKYKHIIVFEDKELLFRQIENILDGKFRCSEVISKREIREYDSFSDDRALEKLRENLYQSTLS